MDLAQMCRLKLFNGFDLKLFYEKDLTSIKKMSPMDNSSSGIGSISGGLGSFSGINSRNNFITKFIKTEKTTL